MRIIISCLLTLALAACKKETVAPTTTLNETIDSTAQFVGMGSFQNGPYGMVMGIAGLYKNYDSTYTIVLDSFTTSNGPDLRVYLSKETMPINFVEAGKLKSTNGRQVYKVNNVPNVTDYKFICVHCKAYNHLFGFAPLK